MMYKVLIVDDDRSIICMLREFHDWESYGFTIEDEACSGKEALQKIGIQSFDLVITDIRMPGMGGLELLSELRIRKVDACLILMSTYNDFEYAHQGIRLGVFDYMTKPIKNPVLGETLERIKRHLDEKKIQQSKVIADKKLMEDNFKFYYPQTQEEKITDLMMVGSYTVIDVASSTCLELFKLTNQDLIKTSMLLETMVLKLRGEINNGFPWLGTLEEIAFDGTWTTVTSIDDSNTIFLNCINIMMKIIKKYELHRPDSIVGKTCQYVLQHVEENIKLDDIANEVYVSRDYIGRLFKQKTGINFIDYVTKIKMEHAKYLLGRGEYKNYEISEKLCYSSPDYFCRLFKGYTGVTPIEFRKKDA